MAAKKKTGKKGKLFKVGIIGFGPAFNMGARHIDSIQQNRGFEVVAVCDLNPAALATAKSQYPKIATYKSVKTMLRREKLQLAVIITPHATHAPLALQCLNEGVGVVTEKPMAITSREVGQMITAAAKRKVMLSTFHNRRWDADYMVLREIVRAGTIGRVFRIEAGFNGYGKQRDWWRSNKDVSGGAIYDWGAHFTDWILDLVQEPVTSVSGFQVKNPAWQDYSNEDHSEYTLRFAGDCQATLTISMMSMIERPRWIIRGDQGSITAASDHFVVRRLGSDGRHWTTDVSWARVESDWDAYYRNVCNHLRDGEPLIITADSAARVIAVLDAADTSAENGGSPIEPAYR